MAQCNARKDGVRCELYLGHSSYHAKLVSSVLRIWKEWF